MTPLEKFGEFLIRNYRDKAIERHLRLQQGFFRTPDLQNLQKRLAALSDDEKKLQIDIIVDLVDTALHDLLFAFQEAHDLGEGIEIVVNDVNIAAEESQMLQGEPMGEGGWIDHFSRFPDLGAFGRAMGKPDREPG